MRPVGARADEDLVHGHLGELLVGLQAHVVEGALEGGALVGVLDGSRIWHGASDWSDVLGGGAPGHLGHDVRGVDHHLLVVGGARV